MRAADPDVAPVGEHPGPQPGSRRAKGPRQARRAERRRARRRKAGLTLASVAALALVVSLGVRLGGGGDDDVAPAAPAAGQDAGAMTALLLVGHPPKGGSATSVTLLAAGDDEGVVLFLPTGLLVDIPGFGQDLLGMALHYGGGQLVGAAVANLLGTAPTHVATVSHTGLASLLNRAGGLEVSVPERMVRRDDRGAPDVRFTPGVQFLNGARLAEYWATRGEDEDEFAAFPRRQAVLDGLWGVIAADEGALDRLLAQGAPQLVSDAPVSHLRGVLDGLAAAHAAGTLTTTLVPAEPFGGGGPRGEPTYRVREEALAETVQTLFAAGLGGDDLVRVQVLNGVGAPGVGQEVDRRLQGGRFRIVLADNARSFDFAETQILVYDEQPETLRAARRVRELLGVGSIAVSRQPQSVVDLTIVVGADFLNGDSPTS